MLNQRYRVAWPTLAWPRLPAPHMVTLRVNHATLTLIVIILSISALPGCGLLPEQSYSVPNSTVVLHYPALWSVSRETSRAGLLTVFSPDAKPGPRSTRITLQYGSISPEPPGRSVAGTAPILGGKPGAGAIQWRDYTQKNSLSPQSLHGATLSQDLGLGPQGLHSYRLVVPPNWAVEAYAPPADFATIRATAERMASALNVKAKPGAEK